MNQLDVRAVQDYASKGYHLHFLCERPGSENFLIEEVLTRFLIRLNLRA